MHDMDDDMVECWKCSGVGRLPGCFEDCCSGADCDPEDADLCCAPSRCDVCGGKGGWPIEPPLTSAQRTGELMAGMRVSMSGLFAEVGRQAPNSRLILREVEQHIRQLVRGEVTMEEFAEHYCLKHDLPPKTAE